MKTLSGIQRGFTLIELMAVVLLISIIATASIVVFSVGGPKKEFHSEIEKFVDYAYQVADLSILTGEPVGLVVTPPQWASESAENRAWSYTWRRYVEKPASPIAPTLQSADQSEGQDTQDNQALMQQYFQRQNDIGQWESIEGVETVSLSPDVQLNIELEGHQWDWQSTPKNENPIFVLYPTGEAEPFLFDIEFNHRDIELDPQHVKLDETGRLQWVEARAAMEEIAERMQ